ncbi:MBL fold metallo-hydrolase [Methylolobus aquaticus]
MNLTFIGAGSAFSLESFQSNMLIESRGNRLLVDCGGDARFALNRLGLGAKDIDALYVSHLHADHIGGIEWLCFSRYFTHSSKPELFINNRLAELLWEQSLRGGMASIQERVVELDDFFAAVHRLPANGIFNFGSVRCQLFSTVHYFDGYELVPSYGLLLDVYPEEFDIASPTARDAAPRRRVMLTTDTQFCPTQLRDFYNSADVIFQDCETSNWKSGIHAHYDDLCTLPDAIRAKMWLYHYSDGKLPDAVAAGFAGFVRQGQTFSF